MGIVKLVQIQFHYGLWYADIVNGVYNQFITRGHHIVGKFLWVPRTAKT